MCIRDRKRWISEERFVHALSYLRVASVTQSSVTGYLYWLALTPDHWGIVAGVFFVLPSVFILLILSWIYALHGNVSWVTGFFYGLKPAVVTIVAEAVFRIGKKTLKNWILIGLAVAALIATNVFRVPFPLIVLSAGVLGSVGSRMLPGKFLFSKAPSSSNKEGATATASESKCTHPDGLNSRPASNCGSWLCRG